jgi:hypothetical protein
LLKDFAARSSVGASHAASVTSAASAALEAVDARADLTANTASTASAVRTVLAAVRDAGATSDASVTTAALNTLAARAALDASVNTDALTALDAGTARTAFDAARAAVDARDAVDARAALDAIDALDALAALTAREAVDARAAITARDAMDARDASAHVAALDACEAVAALDARAAVAARSTRDAVAVRDARIAVDARDAVDAARHAAAARDARDARATSVASDALDARAVRDASDALDAARAASDALYGVIKAREAREAPAAGDIRNAIVARDAIDARHRVAQWCIWRTGWWYHSELAWLAPTHLGALSTRAETVLRWTQPVFDAFLAGCWLLHWTEDTLYWVAKPTVHTEDAGGSRRRLHRADGPALVSDIEDLYYWHGVLVPAKVVLQPERITLADIDLEPNTEVRRVMMTRYGYARYLRDSGAQCVHALPDNYYVRGLQGAKLYRLARRADTDVVMVAVRNSTPEPDGTRKEYMLRVDPRAYDGEAGRNSHAAVASTWRVGGKLYFPRWQDYAPRIET